MRKYVDLPHLKPRPGHVAYFDNWRQVLDILEATERKFISQWAHDTVEEARKTGSYENRTGNLRRLITANSFQAMLNVESLPFKWVMVEEADGIVHKRKQYRAKAGFYTVRPIRSRTGWSCLVSAIMPYARAVEAKGYAVLTQAVHTVAKRTEQMYHRLLYAARVKVKG